MRSRRAFVIGAAAAVLLLHGTALWWVCGTGATAPLERQAPVLHLRLVPAGTAADALAASTHTPDDRTPRPPIAQALRASRFLAADQLDRPALPRSAPDVTALQGLPFSGLPIRMRLFIDETGRVVDVEVLGAGDTDMASAAALKRMFLSTNFIAGRRGGADVASRQDIELTLASTL